MTCPDDNHLIRLAHGGVSGDDLVKLEAHLDGCPDCRTLVAAVAGGSAKADPRAPVQVLEPGQRMGRYEIERLIGAGGMGVLYVARDTKLDRRVALKLMRPHYADEVGRARLLREAQAMARLSHPNVVNVFDLGEVDERVFVAMEFVEGGTLRDWLKTPREAQEVLSVFSQAGQGLLAAHRAGIVHRDFKPENVLIGADGRARVTDFGLARPGEFLEQPVKQLATGPVSPRGASSPLDLTQTGTVLGTPAYMSPEQLRLEPADARSDQYSFCVSLYEALEGRRPFAGSTLAEVHEGVLGGRFARPARIPEAVARVLERGMSLSPAGRFASMESLLSALSAKPRRKALPWLAAVAALSVLLGVGVQVFQDEAQVPVPPPAPQPLPVALAPTPTPPKGEEPRAVEVEEFNEPLVPEPLPADGSELAVEPWHSRTFDVSGAARVVISNPRVADVEVEDTTLTLTGADLGRTTLSVTVGGKTRRWPVVVRTAVMAQRLELALQSGEQREVQVPGLTRLTMGDASIVDVTMQGDGRLRFVAGEPGRANVFVWTRDARRLEYLVEVVAVPVSLSEPPVELVVGLQQVLTFKGVTRVAVSDPAVCEVKWLGAEELLLLPQRPGKTTLQVWSGQTAHARALLVRGAP
ncbi:MAG: protein kinase [Archangium sp.]|nr:protein kinase [Archangium sp.]